MNWLTPVFNRIGHCYQLGGYNKLTATQWHQSACGASSLPDSDLTHFLESKGHQRCRRCLRTKTVRDVGEGEK